MDSYNNHQQLSQEVLPYTEFFSWGSDQFGQLALANQDDEENNHREHLTYSQISQFYEEPKSLSFDILIKQISCGDYHAAFISADNFIFSVGRNSSGQLGIGDPTMSKSSAPLLVDQFPKEIRALQVSCGGSHTAAVIDNGEIYMWGCGQFGATGLGHTRDSYQPVKIEIETKIVQVSCGKKHTLVVDINGDVWVCGDNKFRQLGVQRKEKVCELEKLEFRHKAKSVAAGIDHSLLLTEDDRIFAVGNNQSGNLGLGHTYSSDNFLLVHGISDLSFQQIAAGRHSAAITNDGKLYVWGQVFKNEEPLLLPQELRSNRMIQHISIGGKTSAIIDDELHLYTWGDDNSLGQLGRKDFPESAGMPQIVESLAHKQVTRVAVGLDYILALGQDFDDNGQQISENATNSNQLLKESFITPTQTRTYDPYPQRQESEQRFQQYDDYQNERDFNNQSNFSQQTPKEIQQKQFEYQPIQQESIQKDTSTNDKQVLREQNSQVFNNPRTSYSSERRDYSKEKPYERKTNENHTNVELYKQLDQLREENFSLKQKQRELITKMKDLKEENEQLLTHADKEIKRMSEFVDEYTKEVEQIKKDQEQEYEQRLLQERKNTEELKQKFMKEQNEIDKKLDQLQKEIETLRQENLYLQKEKTDSQFREKNLLEKLDQTNQKLKNTENQVFQIQQEQAQYKLQQEQDRQRHQNQTPNKNVIYEDYQKAKTPLSYNRSQFAIVDNRTNPKNYNAKFKEEEQSIIARRNSQQRESIQYSSIKANEEAHKSFRINNQYSTIENKTNYSPFYQRNEQPNKQSRLNEKESPSKIQKLLDLYSPEAKHPESQKHQNERSQYSYSKQYILQEEANNFHENESLHNETLDDYQRQRDSNSSGFYKHNQKITSNKNYPREINQNHNSLIKYQNNNPHLQTQSSTTTNFTRNEYSKHYDSTQKTNDFNQVSGENNNTSLNDVKNRLMVMQKNKEELEEKLRSYETKIRQHFHRQQ